MVISTDRFSDRRDEIVLILNSNTGSGKVEAHTWNSGYQSWRQHKATLVTEY